MARVETAKLESRPGPQFGLAAQLLFEAGFEEGVDFLGDCGVLEPAVTAAGDGVEFVGDVGFLQGGGEEFALAVGDQWVLVAMDDEEGRVGGIDVGDRVGASDFVRDRLDRRAEELGFRGVGGVVFLAIRQALGIHLGDIGGAEKVDHTGDFGILIGVRTEGAVHFWHPGTGAEDGGEVAAGGGAPNDKAVGVEVVLFGVGFDPADRGFAVVDLGGPWGFAAEAVANTDSGGLAFGHGAEDLTPALGFVAGQPGTAVNEDEDRERFPGFTRFGQVEVELLALVIGAGVGQVGHRCHGGWKRWGLRPVRTLGLQGGSGHQAGEGERQESAHGREQDEDARIAELDEAGEAVVTLTLVSGGLFRGPFYGGGESHAAAAAEPLVDGFQFMDEVADFLAGVGAAGGIAEVGAAGKGAGIVNGATAVRSEERAGAVGWQWEFFLSGGAGGGVGHEGFAPGEKGGAAGQAEPAAFGAVQAIPLNGPLGEPGVDFPDLKEKGGTFCGSEASGHGEVSLGDR